MSFNTRNFIDKLTLPKILFIALAVRLVSAIFSRGYGMYDDHFLVIEIAQSWVDGPQFWIANPRIEGNFLIDGHNLLYPAIHFILFKFFQFLSITDPQVKMLIVRILHAFYSLLVVYYGYRITAKLAGEKCAKYCALLLALLWFMPNLSVRNLVEMVCIVPLLFGCWHILKDEENGGWKFFIAGFVAAFAFSIRYQTALFLGGMGLVLLFEKRWRGFVFFSLGCLLNIALVQCIADYIIWGYPLASFIGYINYNILNRGNYPSGPWYNYLLLITGLVLPPLSVMFWFGYFRNIRKHLLLFLPSLLFLLFHSYFPNKQERFILPFVPFFIILGVVGWYQFQQSSGFWNKRIKLQKGLIWFAVIINTLLLSVTSVASTKTSRMDAMYYLYKRHDVKSFIIECSNGNGREYFPRYYLGSWAPDNYVTSEISAERLKSDLKDDSVQPNYVVFLADENIERRIAEFKNAYPNLTYLATISPSFIDVLFYKLNPVNSNEPCFIYAIGGN